LFKIIPEEKYYLLGFVAGKDIKIEKDTWLIILNPEKLDFLADCFKGKILPNVTY
jgi:hypothetical protein